MLITGCLRKLPKYNFAFYLRIISFLVTFVGTTKIPNLDKKICPSFVMLTNVTKYKVCKYEYVLENVYV